MKCLNKRGKKEKKKTIQLTWFDFLGLCTWIIDHEQIISYWHRARLFFFFFFGAGGGGWGCKYLLRALFDVNVSLRRLVWRRAAAWRRVGMVPSRVRRTNHVPGHNRAQHAEDGSPAGAGDERVTRQSARQMVFPRWWWPFDPPVGHFLKIIFKK